VQYLNGTAQFAATGEGRVYNNAGTYRYDYFMKDQVGNIRLTYTANGTGVTVLQRDEYYPFGNTFDSYLGSGGANAYKFNGMEFQENGVNTFDFHARMYDPQIGRSFQPDPHADYYAAKSPFSFLANNPIRFTDPTGMDEEEWDDEVGGGGGTIASSSIEGAYWFLKSGGRTETSQKWMGLVKANDKYYYKGKEVSTVFALTLYSFGRTPMYIPAHISYKGFKEEGMPSGTEIIWNFARMERGGPEYNKDVDNRLNELGTIGDGLDAAAALSVAQNTRFLQRGVDAAADAAKFAKLAGRVGIAANVLAYRTALYQIATDHDNTSTWVDVGVTTAGIVTVAFVGTVAAPFVAAGSLIYGVWSIAGGGDWIDKNWGYR
jgi:RHS repeat-associated protein